MVEEIARGATADCDKERAQTQTRRDVNNTHQDLGTGKNSTHSRSRERLMCQGLQTWEKGGEDAIGEVSISSPVPYGVLLSAMGGHNHLQKVLSE